MKPSPWKALDYSAVLLPVTYYDETPESFRILYRVFGTFTDAQ